MLIFNDVLGTEVPAYVSDVAETQNLNEIGQLDFTILNTPKNELAYPMLAPRTLVTVPETGRQYRLSANAGMSQGLFKQRTITALHVGHDLHDKYIDTQLTGSQSLEACMNFLTKGTKFSYNIHGSFNHYSFSEGFGNGFADALFLDNLKNDFGFEFYFDNYVIHIYKSLGKRNQFLFIDNANCQKIADSSDYTTIATHIKGVGKRDDKGTPIVSAEYTSPNAKVYGVIDAEKVDDETFTKKDSLLDCLKAKLQDYPLIQYTVDAINFEKNLNQGELSKLRIGDYGFLKDRFDVDIETRLTGLVTYPQGQTAPKVTFGNKKMGLSQFTVSLMKNKKNTKKVTDLSGEIKEVDEKATNAFKSRLYGEVVKEIETVKAYQLIAPDDNEEMGLAKAESYFVLTHAESVKGLTEFVQKMLPDIPNVPVLSVNGKTGVVKLTAADVGALDLYGTAIAAKQADKLTTPRSINGVPFDGTEDILIDGSSVVLDDLEQRVQELEKLTKGMQKQLRHAVYLKEEILDE